MTQISRGLDEAGTLQTDIVVNGHVPALADAAGLSATVRVLPYVDDFVQLAPGTCARRPLHRYDLL